MRLPGLTLPAALPTRSRVARRSRALCVDDEPVILAILDRLLSAAGFDVVTAGEPRSALELFDGAEGRPFDLVVTDIHMPGMDGHALVQAVRERDVAVPIVVITGHGTLENAIRALREGASGMVVKPFTGEELLREVRSALESAQTRHEAIQFRFVSPILDAVALALSSAIEARNHETGEHCRQLGALGERMAELLGLDDMDRTTIRIGGYLHDVGKIGIADRVLLKPGPLTDEEFADIQRHAEIGGAILEVHEGMAGIARIVRHHHEWWDGTGYPSGLARGEIPIGARIVAVADAFSAMTTDRCYRRALTVDDAWSELRRGAGRQFDPQMVELFEQVVDFDGRLREPMEQV